jgi:hypothetical protein
VLDEGRGLLVPFADSAAMAQATLRLLSDAALLAETRRRAYQYVKPMFWPNVGRLYLDFFGRVVAANEKQPAHPFRSTVPTRGATAQPRSLVHGGV